MSGTHPLGRRVALSSIPPSGSVREIVATDTELATIAQEFGLLELRTLAGQLNLRRSGDLVTIDGRLVADAVQRCVVSLEPVLEHIDQPFLRRLLRGERAEPTTVEETIEIGADDPPDSFAGDSIDVGLVLLEEFALALDPYPRAPGVEFAAPEEASADSASPFAVLKAKGRRDAT